MLKLGISEHEIEKISKKGDFRNFMDQFLDFTLKINCDPCSIRKPFGTKLMIDSFFLDSSLGIISN